MLIFTNLISSQSSMHDLIVGSFAQQIIFLPHTKAHHVAYLLMNPWGLCVKGRTNKLSLGSSQAAHSPAARSLLILEASPTGKGGVDCSSTITISVARF